MANKLYEVMIQAKNDKSWFQGASRSRLWPKDSVSLLKFYMKN